VREDMRRVQRVPGHRGVHALWERVHRRNGCGLRTVVGVLAFRSLLGGGWDLLDDECADVPRIALLQAKRLV
jgi:hypothetical protein